MFRKRSNKTTSGEAPAATPDTPNESLEATLHQVAEAVEAAASGNLGDAVAAAVAAAQTAAPLVESLMEGEGQPVEPAAASGAVAGLDDEQLAAIADHVSQRVPPTPVITDLTAEQVADIARRVAERMPPPQPTVRGLTDQQLSAIADAIATQMGVAPTAPTTAAAFAPQTLTAKSAQTAAQAAHAVSQQVEMAAREAAEKAAQDVATAAQTAAAEVEREAEAAARRQRGGPPLGLALLFGAAAGAVAAYFLSPYSGEELRSLLAERRQAGPAWEPPVPSAGPEADFQNWELRLRADPPSAAEIRSTARDWAANETSPPSDS